MLRANIVDRSSCVAIAWVSVALFSIAVARDASAQAPVFGPGPAPVDVFNPDRQPGADGAPAPLKKPAWGGRAIVHLESMPTSLCVATVNSGVLRRMMYELHETLLMQDWESHAIVPDLAASYTVEDTLVLKQESDAAPRRILFGAVTEEEDAYRVEPRSARNPLGDAEIVPKAKVASLERATVFTFQLRPGVRWHDGHPFDANDVFFSWAIYKNKKVDCDEKRYQFLKVVDAEVLDSLTIRFFYEKQYFRALDSVGDMFILPSHLYNLSDPDNARYDAAYHAERKARDPAWTPSEEEQGAYINKNVHNQDWVGLGPYRVTHVDSEYIEATRFEDYFDKVRAGYLDTIRWRFIQNDAVAMQALLNGELDFFARVSAEDYFGETTEKPLFTDRFYKGYYYSTLFWYCAWNTLRPKFSDVRVRQALAHCFDFESFKQSQYRGLAIQVTGPQSFFSRGYDTTVVPYPFDLGRASELLSEAGWYDRDNDGIVDKDGAPFEIEFLMQAGNKVNEGFGREMQANLARVGIRAKMTSTEWATLIERKLARDFDAMPLGWVPPLESDPEQAWHSKWGAADKRSTNLTGLQDEVVDRLIERGQREIDNDQRFATWRELHRRIYELQPMLFGYNSPRKFAMNRKIFGFQAVAIDPNYVIRRWYYPAGTPGTRSSSSSKRN